MNQTEYAHSCEIIILPNGPIVARCLFCDYEKQLLPSIKRIATGNENASHRGGWLQIGTIEMTPAR